MNINEMYNKLLQSRRPFDFFGKITDINELKKLYRKFVKIVHPDTLSAKDQYISGEAFNMLSRLYSKANEEFSKGIYGVNDPVKLYSDKEPLFEISIKGKAYKFYENIWEGEVAYIYKGLSENEIVYLKTAIDINDNELIENEYNVLSAYRHQSLPYIEKKIKIDNQESILMREVKGITMPELMQQYPNGIPAEHVMWMLERLLSVVGWLHSNCVVHGNIKPENIIINKDNHNVSLVGFSFCIPDANKESAAYKIINDYYTAPEIEKDARVMPSSDIYSVGKIAVELLGGSILTNGMPVAIDSKIRDFIRKMVADNPNERPDDAWNLWSELIALRTEVYGTQRFKKLD